MKDSKTASGVHTVKRVFQLRWIDRKSGEIVSLQLKRDSFLEYFANRASCLGGGEACGGVQHWAWKRVAMGPQIELMQAKAGKPFFGGNQNDAQVALDNWTAAQQPGIRAVAVKMAEPQAILALHRMRQQLVRFRPPPDQRKARSAERIPRGHRARTGIKKEIAEAPRPLADWPPAMGVDPVREQWTQIGHLDEQITAFERRLEVWQERKTD